MLQLGVFCANGFVQHFIVPESVCSFVHWVGLWLLLLSLQWKVEDTVLETRSTAPAIQVLQSFPSGGGTTCVKCGLALSHFRLFWDHAQH